VPSLLRKIQVSDHPSSGHNAGTPALRDVSGWFFNFIHSEPAKSRWFVVTLLVLIGFLDYWTGYEYSLNAFYLIPVMLATWSSTKWFAYVMAVFSACIPVVTSIMAGERFGSLWVPSWNFAILCVSYAVVIELLAKLRAFQADLENRVRDRTADLRSEIAIREDLERKILSISDRERSRLGQDLHDVLCQQLMACAMASQVLQEKLALRSAPELGDAQAFASVIDESLELARDIAHGLSPIPFDNEGLSIALEELASRTADRFQIQCNFVSDCTNLALHPSCATHLYRIAMESITNAIRHGDARRIDVDLATDGDRGVLTVSDNGSGVASEILTGLKGLGVRIMRHRASLIGGTISFLPGKGGGVVVRCEFPNESRPSYDDPS
jgi:signal transduction histidine kinase